MPTAGSGSTRRSDSVPRPPFFALSKPALPRYAPPVPEGREETALDRLWKEYGRSFREFDDLTLARWCSQTLGQLRGRAWRLSHPLVGALRLAAQQAHDRQVWQQRLVNIPAGYLQSPCCRAPLLPLLTRDVGTSGLVCLHCNETAVPPDQLPPESQRTLADWSGKYAPVHEVAHWDDTQRKAAPDYDAAFEEAAQKAEDLLAELATQHVNHLLESYPALVWEDQDECLEVRPEDIHP